MKGTLSRTVEVNQTSDIAHLVKTFEPIARAFCLSLQSNKVIGRRLKIGVRDGDEWQGVAFEFIVWRYDDLMKQIGGNLAVSIEWESASAIHLSISDIESKDSETVLGSPDLV